MKKRSSLILAVIASTAFASFAFAEDSACHDLRETHHHIDQAIKNLEHHRDQGKRMAIIDALKSARRDVVAEKTNLGCK